MPRSRMGLASETHKARLKGMVNQGHLILTPSRRSDGAPWSSFQNFDCNVEDYIVQYAAQHEAVIVSTREFPTTKSRGCRSKCSDVC